MMSVWYIWLTMLLGAYISVNDFVTCILSDVLRIVNFVYILLLIVYTKQWLESIWLFKQACGLYSWNHELLLVFSIYVIHYAYCRHAVWITDLWLHHCICHLHEFIYNGLWWFTFVSRVLILLRKVDNQILLWNTPLLYKYFMLIVPICFFLLIVLHVLIFSI